MPELRHDPLQKRWVIIATERARRPMDFSFARASDASMAFDPFEPGNEEKTPPEIFSFRDSGTGANTPGWQVRVVPNKFPALRIEGDLDREGFGIYDKMNGVGAHEVIIETPKLENNIENRTVEQITVMLKTYKARLNDLRRDNRFRYVLIFKNHGVEAGATLPHPHSQIIATPVTPKAVAVELESAKNYYHLKERCIFCDILKQEMRDGSRIVLMNEKFVVLCPYASRFPFEMMLLPRKHSHDFGACDDQTMQAMAEIMQKAFKKLSMSLDDPPYNFMLHTAPNITTSPHRQFYWNTLEYDWHWHLEIIPRVTRMAGFEWGTDFYINHVAPEMAAQFLREVDNR